MKKLLLTVFGVSSLMAVYSQADTSLIHRLKGLALAFHTSDFDKLPDFFHPKMFTNMSKDDMRQGLKSMSNNSGMMNVYHDSLIVQVVYPAFKVKDTSYARINALMKLVVAIKLPEKKPEEMKEFLSNKELLANLKTRFHADELFVDKNNTIVMYISSPMVAIKDNDHAPWGFLGLDERELPLRTLLSKETLDKLNSYQ